MPEKIVKVRGDIGGLSAALALYESNTGRYPTTEQGLAALVDRPTLGPMSRAWRQQMTRLPVDPWDEEFRYECPASHQAEGFDLYSSGPDRIPNTEDDIGNWMEFHAQVE